MSDEPKVRGTTVAATPSHYKRLPPPDGSVYDLLEDETDAVTAALANTRTKQFQTPHVLFATTPTGPQRWPYPVQAPAAKLMPVKTCLQCGARVPTNPDGTVPDGAMPCGH